MEKDPVLVEARQLYDHNFAIHWLRPKSKIPLESGWTTGPRKEWSYLEKTYSPGLNLGVRLGTPSKIGKGFLTVIDVDIKSTDSRHLREALDAVRKLIGDVRCPVVLSGRGNGSRHYYCLSPRPFKTWNPAQSKDIVKFSSPSKKPSKKELETLTPEELKNGIRLSHAWEVSLYSDGRQVVLPPSIHPDSQKRYKWGEPLITVSDLPLLQISEESLQEDASAASNGVLNNKNENGLILGNFKAEPVDLAWLPISNEVRAGILEGVGVTDRSAYLMKASSALFNAGLTENEVLSVLSDPTTFLGACAYDHARTKDRARAVKWLRRFTTKKVLEDRTSVEIFRDVPFVIPESEAEDRGFHYTNAEKKKVPDYEALLKEFQKERPYKSVADMKAVYVFKDTHYVDFTPIEIKAFSEIKFSPKPSERTRNEFFSKVLANNVVRRNFFTESTEGKLNFKNGVLDLNTDSKVLLPHGPQFGFRGVLPYDYDPQAKCPFFEKWLAEVLQNDLELMRLVQEFMGYVVRGGEYRYHKALWLQGEGRNGKSTFIDVLKAVIGNGNYSTISIKTLVGDKFAGADLDGKIANFSEETSPHELRDSGPFKNLTGDGDLYVQKKFGDPYSFRNIAKLIMSYNQIPDLSDLSAGMLSRPLIVPFKKEIPESEQDHSIKDKLFAELPGIFNFALRGWDRLEKQNRFTTSQESQTALTNIRHESCTAHQWILNYVEFTDDVDEVSTRKRPTQLYASYRVKETYPYKMVEFCRRINRHPKIKERVKHDEKGNYYWGLKLT